MFKRILSVFLINCFVLISLGPLPQAYADLGSALPAPGAMVNLSPPYQPVMIKGLTVHKDNPFLFDFIVDIGQDRLNGEPLKKEGERLIKYFLASLAIPDKDVWVNLSPYEKDKMIPQALGQTDMGRDLLEQDYILKQITASLIYPEKQLGKTFWDKVYAKAQEEYGTTQIPVDTFNKVWIMADRAEVLEHNQTAFVVDSHLKVMLEEDYLALKKHSDVLPLSAPNDSHSIGANIVKEIILPQLEEEVNTGKNFANLRQIFNSIILSSWYKRSLRQALLNQVYADKSKIKGINLNDPQIKQQIYNQYLKAYKKGVFNYIKDEVNSTTGRSLPRKYFSGGINPAMAATPEVEELTDHIPQFRQAEASNVGIVVFSTILDTTGLASKAMLSAQAQELISRINGSGFLEVSDGKAKLVREEDIEKDFIDVRDNKDFLLRNKEAMRELINDNSQEISMYRAFIATVIPYFPDLYQYFTEVLLDRIKHRNEGGEPNIHAKIRDVQALLRIGDYDLELRKKIQVAFETTSGINVSQVLIDRTLKNWLGQERLIAMIEPNMPYLMDPQNAWKNTWDFLHEGDNWQLINHYVAGISGILRLDDIDSRGYRQIVARFVPFLNFRYYPQFVDVFLERLSTNPFIGDPNIYVKGTMINSLIRMVDILRKNTDLLDERQIELMGRIRSRVAQNNFEVSNLVIDRAIERWESEDASRAMISNDGRTYIDIAKDRIQAIVGLPQFTKHSAELSSDLETFEDPDSLTMFIDYVLAERLNVEDMNESTVKNVRGRLESIKTYIKENREVNEAMTVRQVTDMINRLPNGDITVRLGSYLQMLAVGHRNSRLFENTYRMILYVNTKDEHYLTMTSKKLHDDHLVFSKGNEVEVGVQDEFIKNLDSFKEIARELAGRGQAWNLAVSTMEKALGLESPSPAMMSKVPDMYKEGDLEMSQMIRLTFPHVLFKGSEEYQIVLIDGGKEVLVYDDWGHLIDEANEEEPIIDIDDFKIIKVRGHVYVQSRYSHGLLHYRSIENSEIGGGFKHRDLRYEESDPAMLKDETPGGIDLNTSYMHWKVNKDGQGVEMDVNPAMLARVKREGIDWLSPVIFKMTPVSSVLSLVGLEAPAK